MSCWGFRSAGTVLFATVNFMLLIYFVTRMSKIESTYGMHFDNGCQKSKISTQNFPNMRDLQNTSTSPNSLAINFPEPTIFVITPTYTRTTQKPDLTRLAQTLMLVKGLHWIVVEDAPSKNDFVKDLLERSGVNSTHLNVVTPQKEKKSKVRGCSQRNAALTWIKEFCKDGVMYFADDDNAYDIRLFSEIRDTKKVGLFPTGNLANTGLSSPIVRQGKVEGFVDVWKANRKFPVEMASISINVAFWLERGSPLFDYHKAGYLETSLLEGLNITMSDIEPKAKNCTMMLAWHTKTINVKMSKIHVKDSDKKDSNIPKLMDNVVYP